MITEPEVERWRRRSSFRLSAGVVTRLIVAWALLSLSVAPFFDFPVIGSWAPLLAIAYLALLFFLPHAWLYALPIATAALDLSTFTGRPLFALLDLLVLVTVAGSLAFDRYRLQVLRPTRAIVGIELLFVCMLVSFNAWHTFVSPPGQLSALPWLDMQYAYAGTKGLIWGLLLMPVYGFAMGRDKARTTLHFVVGFSLAAALLMLTILLETVAYSGSVRPAQGNWWPTLSDAAFLPTAFLADSRLLPETPLVLLLLFAPILMFGAVQYRPARLPMATLLFALALVLYASGSTALIAAFTLGTVAFIALEWRVIASAEAAPALARRLVVSGFLLLLCMSVTVALAGAMGAVAAFSTLALTRTGSIAARVGYSLAILCSLSAWLLTTPELSLPHLASAVGIGLALLAGARVALTAVPPERYEQPPRQHEQSASLDLACLLVPISLAMALVMALESSVGGATPEPAATAEPPAASHERKWSSPLGLLFGEGIGSSIAHAGSRIPHIGVSSTPGTSLLQLEPGIHAGSQPMLGQRISLAHNSEYKLIVRARAETGAPLSVLLCEGIVRLPPRSLEACQPTVVEVDGRGESFTRYELTIQSGQPGEGLSLVRMPGLLLVRNDSPDTLIEIDSIALTYRDLNLLSNSAFAAGLDHWNHYLSGRHEAISDKSLYARLLFEGGVLSVLLLAGLMAYSVFRATLAHARNSLAPSYAATVLSIGVLGIFIDPLLSARVGWLFFFLLFASLVNLKHTSPAPPAPSRRRRNRRV